MKIVEGRNFIHSRNILNEFSSRGNSPSLPPSVVALPGPTHRMCFSSFPLFLLAAVMCGIGIEIFTLSFFPSPPPPGGRKEERKNGESSVISTQISPFAFGICHHRYSHIYGALQKDSRREKLSNPCCLQTVRMERKKRSQAVGI